MSQVFSATGSIAARQPGPNTLRSCAHEKEHAALLASHSSLIGGPDIVCSRTPLSFWGRTLRARPPHMVAPLILVWRHTPCGHSHAGARQWSYVIEPLCSSLGLLKS